MFQMKSAVFLALAASQASAVSLRETACLKEDVKNRAELQNKVAGVCEDMCKEVGAYPMCTQCPDFVQPDSTPGVMTWPELLEHMDNLAGWGQDELKGWHSQARALLQMKTSCAKQEKAVLALLSEKSYSMGADCEAMCKKIGAFPNCQCPGFGGQAASSDDTRACMTKYCQDPASPCPNDAFVTCVDDKCDSIMSFLQVMNVVDKGLKSAEVTSHMKPHKK